MKLKPCPFCGSDKNLTTEIISPISDNQDSHDWYVACNKCSTFGPYASSKDGAIEKWNARPLEDGK